MGFIQKRGKKGWFKEKRRHSLARKGIKTTPLRFPKPEYPYCNAGHRLVEIYDEKKNRFDWDCPICIRKMQYAEGVKESYRITPEVHYTPVSDSKFPYNIPDQESNIKILLKKERDIPNIQLKNSREVADYVGNMQDHDREFFKVLYLDTKNRVVGIETISVGSLSAGITHPREVYKGATLANAATIIAVHNHPSGDITPSKDDIDTTRRLKEAGELIRIPLLDHVIVGKEGFVSLTKEGMF